jgi:hypothetical protein|tara:strand:- start:3119 stop:3319 length:201 start_codon:yes stop_codon:yes gene_type:complete
MIIKLYDESDYEYPFIKIDEDYFNIFKKFLEEYKDNEDYNLEDFLDLLIKKKWCKDIIHVDEEVYF